MLLQWIEMSKIFLCFILCFPFQNGLPWGFTNSGSHSGNSRHLWLYFLTDFVDSTSTPLRPDLLQGTSLTTLSHTWFRCLVTKHSILVTILIILAVSANAFIVHAEVSFWTFKVIRADIWQRFYFWMNNKNTRYLVDKTRLD